MASHQCPRDGCTRQVPSAMLMCRPDWFRVPKPIRDALWAAWDNGHGAGTPAHRAAMGAAIDAVNKQLAAPPPPKPSWLDAVRQVVGACIDHEHKQVGRCVYCVPCGRRLYTGTPWTAEEKAAVKEALAEAGQ